MTMDVGRQFDALIADSEPFSLLAGRYMVACDIGGATAVALEMRSPAGGDVWLLLPSREVAPVAEGEGGGSLDVGFLADGVLTADLGSGEYRIAVTHSEGAGAAVAISRIR
jgi:hypothetical protein